MAVKEQKSAKNARKQKGSYKKNHAQTDYQRERDALKKKRKGAGTPSVVS